jgi:general secretion pathway protein L
VQLQGQAKEAAKLIALLSNSACLGDPRLQGQIQPDPRTGKERFQITADSKPCNSAPDAKSPPGIGAGEPKATADAPLKSDAIGKPVPGNSDTTKADVSRKEPQKKDPAKKEPAKGTPKKGATTMRMPASMGAAFASLAAEEEAGHGNRC